MMDNEFWLSIAAVVVSAAVALTAVYLGYRLQLKSARADRRRETFADLLANLGGAFEAAVVIQALNDEVNRYALKSTSRKDCTVDDMISFVAKCDACRTRMGVTAPGGLAGRVWREVSEDNFAELGTYIYACRDALVQVYYARDETLRRGIAAAFILGASELDRKMIDSLRRRLADAVSLPSDPAGMQSIQAELSRASIRLQRAAEE